ncbi:MAG TPA: hypothetical protein DEB05_13815 [Firmicutes bacterium]|nr:hypothetical protein [Bacillota bacterium]HBT18018.1 hypothetical protein [Bacillota bacterium]
MYGIILVLIIALLGGFIALLGDRVGMKVGKKRLSLFGLRPKYTSMIITVLTGIFIAGFTLLLMTIISNDVRTALFRMKTLQQELLLKGEKEKALTTEVLKNETALLWVNRQKEKTETLLKKTEEQYEEKLVELQKTKDELALEQRRLDDLEQVTKTLKENKVALEVERERLLKEIQAFSSEASLLRENLNIGQAGRIIFLEGEILGATVVEAGSDQKKIQNLLEQMLADANKLGLERGARLKERQDYALMLTKKFSDLQAYAASLVAREQPGVLRLVAEHNTVVFEPLAVSFQYFPNELIFKQGEVISETVVSPLLKEKDLLDQVLNLLLALRKKALARGMISERQYIGENLSLQEVSTMIKKIKASSTPLVLQMVAATDTWRVKGPIEVGINLVRKDGQK